MPALDGGAVILNTFRETLVSPQPSFAMSSGIGLAESIVIGALLLLFISVVLAIPLFYTLITRWAFSSGRPVPEEAVVERGGGPESAAGRVVAPSVAAPTDAVVDVGLPQDAGVLGAGAATLPAAAAGRPHPEGARLDDRLGVVFDKAPEARDDLTRLKGVASVIESKLHGYGVYTFRQIAQWNDDQVRAFSEMLSFKDRINRDDWRGQCRQLHKEKYGEDI